MIAAVTFDVWETMIHDDPVPSEARSALRVRRMAATLRHTGVRVIEQDLREAYDRSWGEYERVWDCDAEVDTAEQIEIILDLANARDGRNREEVMKALTADYVDPVFDLPPTLNDGLVEVLEMAKAQGKRLGLICNTGRTPGYAMRRLLEDYQVLGYFDALAFSNEEGIRKPNREIFRRVLERLGVPASQAVHVGDNALADIAGAKGAGMRAIQILLGQALAEPEALPGTAHADARITSLRQLWEALKRVD